MCDLLVDTSHYRVNSFDQRFIVTIFEQLILITTFNVIFQSIVQPELFVEVLSSGI